MKVPGRQAKHTQLTLFTRLAPSAPISCSSASENRA